MSGACEEYMEMSDMGLISVPDRRLCYRHIDERFVIKYIQKNAIKGVCDYCKRNTTVISLEELMIFIMEKIGSLYTDPANFMRYESQEGGYQGTIYDGWEIINDNFGLDITDSELFNDMEESIDYDKAWGDEEEYYDSEADVLFYHWDYFKDVVKHRSRYLFGNTNSLHSEEYNVNPFDILKDIGNKVKKYHLIRKMDVGTIIQRCRQHLKTETIVTSKQICSPETKYAINPNRMTPAGISMFYGAFELSTCLKETLDIGDKEKNYYTTASFKTKGDLNIIDFSKLPKLPSPFDDRRKKDRYPLDFLRQFIKDLSKPVEKDSMVHIEYVPTQVITEYFRFTFSDRKKSTQKIDGIIYPSARDVGKNACVLFMNHKESLEHLQFMPDTISRYEMKK